MSSPALLCECCSQIPLDPKRLDAEAKRLRIRAPTWSLGAAIRIKNSSCPLCRLFISQWDTDFIANLSTEEIELRWMLGPAGRWAFTTYGAGPHTWIGFRSGMETSGSPDPALGLFLEPRTDPLVDTSRILRWISSCEELHGSECTMPTDLPFTEAFPGLRVLRLIDVEDHCIVERATLEKYIALSYNDTEDLELGVNVMDLVYERAWLTIIAACGHDADARLPGIQEGTRDGSYNSFKIVPGVEMGIVTVLDGLLERSVYHSRAWTFQEQVLSRRVLYFVEHKVFYRCRAAEHAEHFVDDLSQTSADWTPGASNPMSVLVNDPVIYLSTMLLLYTKRVSTNQSDTLRAMAGIIRRIAERMKCDFFQGLPTAMFDKFITFFGDGTILHRRSIFPSYSWTGWRGCVDMDLQFTCEDMTMTENIKMWLRDRTWAFAGYLHRRPFADGRYVPNQLDTRRAMPTQEVSFPREVPPYPILQFWTLSLFYRISDIDVFRGTGSLQDSNNKKCGFVFLDGFDETEFFESRGPYEIILLSETSNPRFLASRWVQWQDPYPLTAGQWRFYNIMILEWDGGIAERRGFGVLHQGAVEFSLDPGPSWKEIFLA